MDEPLYRSKPTALSLWREHRVYDDRIELDTIPFGTLRIRIEDVTRASVRPPVVVLDLARVDLGLRDLVRTVKLDFADLHEHVAIEKGTGFWRQLRITPDDPAEFVRRVEEARRERLDGVPRESMRRG